MKKLLLLLVPCLMFLVTEPVAQAARLYFEPKTADVAVSQERVATLYLDSVEPINAMEGTVTYDSNLFEVKAIDDGNSIVSLWIQKPTVATSDKTQETSLHFAGAIPGGYASNHGKIISFRFLAKRAGNAAITLKDAATLLNDGQGTPAKLIIGNSQFTIHNLKLGEAPPAAEEIADTVAPEIFTPTIGQNAEVFDGRYFLVFSSQDKGSGIDHYEITEEQGVLRSLFGPSSGNFAVAESPYLLRDQELQSWIFVKAIDKKGNERLVVVEPPHAPWYQQLLTILVLVILIVLVVLGNTWWKRRRRKRQAT